MYSGSAADLICTNANACSDLLVLLLESLSSCFEATVTVTSHSPGDSEILRPLDSKSRANFFRPNPFENRINPHRIEINL